MQTSPPAASAADYLDVLAAAMLQVRPFGSALASAHRPRPSLIEV